MEIPICNTEERKIRLSKEQQMMNRRLTPFHMQIQKELLQLKDRIKQKIRRCCTTRSPVGSVATRRSRPLAATSRRQKARNRNIIRPVIPTCTYIHACRSNGVITNNTVMQNVRVVQTVFTCSYQSRDRQLAKWNTA
jgi:hypothetical protein